MRALVRSVALLALLALPGVAFGEPPSVANVGDARAAHGATPLPQTVAGGAVTVTPAEGVASITRTVTLHVNGGGPVGVDLPARFSGHAANGRPFVRGTPSSGVADAGADLVLDVSGLPAGTYRLPLSRGGRPIGAATFRLYTPQREGAQEGDRAAGPFGAVGRIAINTSNDATEENETFVAVDPADPARIITSANDIKPHGFGGVSVTSNGADPTPVWAHPAFPTSFDTGAGIETEIPGGDPILAANDQGDLWAGGLSACDVHTPTSRSHIFVHRVAPNTKTFVTGPNVALPTLHKGPTCATDSEYRQDKPQMTIDNWPASPTYGRLYVTWDEPDTAGVDVVVSYCDTNLGPTTPANCDSAGAWKGPYKVSDSSGGGSYISSDPAVGPDGTVYVAWWDYSGANAIAIDKCIPAASAGKACTAWGTDRIVASLSSHLGRTVPFACPTMAQPGGRAAPVPSVATDSAGRIYVAWGDLGTTGTQRCGFDSRGAMTLPDANQDAFNAYVASADTYDRLTANPVTGSASGVRGTNVLADPGDHWFPWVAVERDSGQAYVALYSTRAEPTRQTANYYVRAVVPDRTDLTDTRVQYGLFTKVSDIASDYSDQTCGVFGNDYGDYSGLAASTDGSSPFAFPVWDRRLRGGTGEVYINTLTPKPDTPEAPADNPPLPPVTSEYLPQCAPPPPPPPPPPPTTTTTTTTPPPPPPPVDRKPPTLRVTYSTRVDRKGRYTLRFRAAGEPATGRATLRLATGKRRKLVSGVLATSGRHAFKLTLRLRSKDFRLLRRKHRLRVRLTVVLTDKARNSAHSVKVFTLRPSRR
jgi:hypothetical protein